VLTSGDNISIVPAEPQVIYVPQYDADAVYEQPNDGGVSTATAVAIGALAFGAGMALGAWLNRDCDWDDDDIYYHGWEGDGWIGVNRSYVDVNRSVYVNNSYRNVNINRTVVSRDISNYRRDLDHRAVVRGARAQNHRANRERNQGLHLGNRDRVGGPGDPKRDLQGKVGDRARDQRGSLGDHNRDQQRVRDTGGSNLGGRSSPATRRTEGGGEARQQRQKSGGGAKAERSGGGGSKRRR
jgi:hypothetical protein